MANTETLGLPWDWPAPDEPARGLLLRLAIVNGLTPEDLAERYMGLTIGAIASGDPEILRFFAGMIRCPFETLTESSPVEILPEVRRYKNEKAALVADRKLRGVVLSGRLLGGETRRRMCPKCFRQAPHQRFWWDVMPITTCPIHGLTLATGCRCDGGARLRWTDASFFCCRDCGTDDVGDLNSVPAAADVVAADRYLLGRFGVMTADTVPMLDEGTFYDALDTMERIGAASIAGYQKRWQSAETLDRPVEEVRAVGFDILAKGRLQGLLDELLAGFRKKAPSHVEPALTSAYGWLYHWLNMKAPRENAPLMLEEFHRHADANFYLNGRARKTYPGASDDGLPPTYSLAEASKTAGISREALRRLWVSKGLLREEAMTGRVLVFDGPAVRQLAEELKVGLNLAQAAERLGIETGLLRALMRDRLIKPVYAGGGAKHHYLFLPSEVDAFVARVLGDAPLTGRGTALIDPTQARLQLKLPTPTFIRLIIDGDLKVRGQLRSAAGLRSALVDRDETRGAIVRFSEREDVCPGLAAGVLQVHGNAINTMVAHRMLISRVRKGETVIGRRSLQALRRSYISLQEIAMRVGCEPEVTRRRLDRAGFQVATRFAARGLVAYDREEVEVRLKEIAG